MRRTRTLLHRGYLYAQARIVPAGTPEQRTANRTAIAAVWVDGYKAAQRDSRRRAKAKP